MQIKSETQLIQQKLKYIAKTVIDNGGIIHSDLCITHDSEKLSISCNGAADGSILLMIPDELFIPVTHLEWTGENGKLSYSGDNSQLTSVMQNLLDAMVCLYNATGKIEKVAQRLPAQLLPADPELLAWLMDARPAFELPTTTPARQFIETRLNEKTIKDGKTVGYLMPLIDLLNHHPYGPKYQRTDQGGWLVPLQKPNLNSDECFVRYSKSDSLSIAMWHGYFEKNTRYLASLNCEIQHDILGEIKIKGTSARRRKINAPCVLTDQEVLTLQDIVLEPEKISDLRTLLGLAVRYKHREITQHEAELIADDLIQMLADANIRKYSELLDLCQTDLENHSLRALFAPVAQHQLALLSDLRNVQAQRP